MKIKEIVVVSMLAVGLLGCGKHEPRHFIIMPDVSGSIDRESLQQAFKAIDELVGHLQRGDRITIIPILGDAQAEASGRIIRFEAPKERQAYDTDLRDFRRKLSASLAEMRATALAHPGPTTDILGSIELADQEFQGTPRSPKRLLIVLSDFIQEDRNFDFRKDSRMGNPTTAKSLATKLLKTHRIDFQGSQVYLGMLRSSEYSALAGSRRDAVPAFWIEYFRASRVSTRFVTDGAGLLAATLSSSQ